MGGIGTNLVEVEPTGANGGGARTACTGIGVAEKQRSAAGGVYRGGGAGVSPASDSFRCGAKECEPMSEPASGMAMER